VREEGVEPVTNNGRGGGGGGGAYSRSTFFVTPGQSFSYNVGVGSNPSPGGDTWFGSNTTLMAKGGDLLAIMIQWWAHGGQASEGFGELDSVVGTARTLPVWICWSGGGGSSAGIEANGTNPSRSELEELPLQVVVTGGHGTNMETTMASRGITRGEVEEAARRRQALVQEREAAAAMAKSSSPHVPVLRFWTTVLFLV
jgi:hypothetical protein